MTRAQAHPAFVAHLVARARWRHGQTRLSRSGAPIAQNDDSFALAGSLGLLLLPPIVLLSYERMRLSGETTYRRPVKFNK
jgi:hypothetical protein